MSVSTIKKKLQRGSKLTYALVIHPDDSESTIRCRYRYEAIHYGTICHNSIKRLEQTTMAVNKELVE